MKAGNKRVGLLVGRESSFPPALIREINSRGGSVIASYVRVGEVRAAGGSGYDVIVDRISHEIPFYRAYLKHAALGGTRIINEPFWSSADDKFLNCSVGMALGLNIPRTALLPQKAYKQGIVAEHLSNLQYPLDWNRITEYVGFPAYLKPFDGGGWRKVWVVNNASELMEKYDASGSDCMMLQECISWDRYVRVYCVGRRDALVIPYDPVYRRYLSVDGYLDSDLEETIVKHTLIVNGALGYDVNTVEFAIDGGVPYAIDYMNPAPEADWYSLGPSNFKWLVARLSDYAIELALNPPSAAEAPLGARLLALGGLRKTSP